MRATGKGVVLAVLLLISTACGGDPADRLITRKGVGSLTFNYGTPDLGKGYTTEAVQEDGYSCFAVKDKAGKRVANVFEGASIEVFSPKFKTEAGIHPGMNLHEAAKIAGEKNLYIWIHWPQDYFTIADATTEFGWHVDSSCFIPGKEKFDEISENGTWSYLTLADFKPDAILRSITVFFSYDEEE